MLSFMSSCTQSKPVGRAILMKDVFKNNGKFTLLAGPCAIESQENLLKIAAEMTDITKRLGVDYYFKASFDKANRTAATKYRGPGMEKGLEMLQKVRDTYGCGLVTDIHEPWQAKPVSEIVDIIQIPAFLCRQTDLLQAAAETGKIINVKKAQFLAPEDMKNVIGKLEYFGCDRILLCERGTCFGYQRLVVDMPGLMQMRTFGYPVVFDATHSVQLTGAGENNSNSGQRQYVECLARCAAAAGVDAMFMEVHPNPQEALCDGSCMLPLEKMKDLLRDVLAIHEIATAAGEKRDEIKRAGAER